MFFQFTDGETTFTMHPAILVSDLQKFRFPAGKLVFLMPTKPLVTQQHEACQESCGIPSADAATITGDDPDNWREAAVSPT